MARKSGYPVDYSIGDKELAQVLSQPFRIHATQGQGDVVVAEKRTLTGAMNFIARHDGEASFAIEHPDGSWATVLRRADGSLRLCHGSAFACNRAAASRISSKRNPTQQALRDIRCAFNYLDSLLDLLQKPQGRIDTPNLLKGRVLLHRASKGMRRIIVAVGQQD